MYAVSRVRSTYQFFESIQILTFPKLGVVYLHHDILTAVNSTCLTIKYRQNKEVYYKKSNLFPTTTLPWGYYTLYIGTYGLLKIPKEGALSDPNLAI